MKNKLQIRTSLLAMYILSLPVMLVFHSQSHLKNAVISAHSDIDQLITQDNSDCQLCSFYFDQQLYVGTSVVSELDTFSYFSYQIIVASPVVPSQEQHYLRGPPIV